MGNLSTITPLAHGRALNVGGYDTPSFSKAHER